MIDFILPGKSTLGSSGSEAITNIFNLRPSQLRVSIGFAYTRISPAFRVSVDSVVRFCSKKKMSWVTAGRIVAVVANTKSNWNLPKMDYPQYAMRKHHSVLNSESSIATLATRGPAPALSISASINFRPETVFDFLRDSGNQLFSFIHKFLYVEVRARDTVRSVLALVFYRLITGVCQ